MNAIRSDSDPVGWVVKVPPQLPAGLKVVLEQTGATQGSAREPPR